MITIEVADRLYATDGRLRQAVNDFQIELRRSKMRALYKGILLTGRNQSYALTTLSRRFGVSVSTAKRDLGLK